MPTFHSRAAQRANSEHRSEKSVASGTRHLFGVFRATSIDQTFGYSTKAIAGDRIHSMSSVICAHVEIEGSNGTKSTSLYTKTAYFDLYGR